MHGLEPIIVYLKLEFFPFVCAPFLHLLTKNFIAQSVNTFAVLHTQLSFLLSQMNLNVSLEGGTAHAALNSSPQKAYA